MLPIAGMHVEAGVLTRDSVSHGTLKDTVVDKRHSELLKIGRASCRERVLMSV